jgi:hypothetical protein
MSTRLVFLGLLFAVTAPALAEEKKEEKPRGKAPLVMTINRAGDDFLELKRTEGGLLESRETLWMPKIGELHVYDRDGSELAREDWLKRAKVGTRVYVAADERKVDPAHLKKAPRDALVFWGVVVLTPEPIGP